MSDRAVVVRFENVGKMYKIFSSRSAHALDFLGLARVLPSRRARYREFWALRGIDLELRKGERLGVIGRNGAGKTTLLKLVTGNLAPTEGIVEVDGEVQALLEIGGGLHPEFTGRENIRAALVHLGLSATEIEAAEEDIAAFTELGSFLDQPFKSYSLGMQARLSLAIATTVQPEILIIDEILGAGDAYFFAKSTARMRELLDRGASVLLVSHALDQVQRFCERTIWLERGHIVMEGETAAVVGAYEQFIRELDDRRLRALNARALSLPKDSFDRERHLDTIGVRIDVPPQSRLDVSHIVLCRDDEEEDRIAAGDAQDAASGDAAGLVLGEGSWGNPSSDADRYFRSLDGRGGIAAGSAEFQLWFYYPASMYAVEVTYRLDGAEAEVSVSRNGQPSGSGRLVPSPDWQVGRIEIDRPGVAVDHAAAAGVHWPGVGDLLISTISLLGEAGETAVFEAFSPFKLALTFRARRSGSFVVIPAALIFRWDGVLVTRHVAREEVVDLNEGDVATAQLDLGALRLGNGHYVVTVGLYRFLDPQELAEPEIYDVVDRSYEFEVVGHPRLHNELFHHAGEWIVHTPIRAAATAGSEGGEDA